ncbi:bifunctional phosphopantothenoylcysteine decarboxylase/phosphopantothenate--cysteine ligase CoaBC [Peptoniphilus stercorisuis]|uniref:Coenzyme A biosynthesis bifunctional protein CoaBC n=1 Tax=Peptoniphilus stercorisuis TaxID=1436965 RepID=A0ABS4KEM9_9FIRM|nr:bifunctional phosphopantothenoylcysteine decarboxylase/phosphopantothenate--cysteine ligase CoaBC [Peptoniphilus stercorisuis]MBP2025845.1 phosphopantothenoylcysteine decarboxylase/phosphopantothenate--cysteine ligase [Peptoniphilus stercorisuis]
MLKDKNILLGVTGGIAAYKAPGIVSLLRKKGANVKVIMTKAACEFVTPLTFQTMSNNIVHTEMFNQLSNMDVEHISLAKWADLIIIAPASANTIAKMANGIADNMLSTVLLAARSKILVAPAMNTFMLNNVATVENLNTLRQRGVTILDTQSDVLACGDEGSGKMLEPKEIVDEIDTALTKKDLLGKRFVITSGPTVEKVDPVRYISNHSSGKMGYALANAAVKRGAEVVLISGPTSLQKPHVKKVIDIETTLDMYNAVEEEFNSCDVLIKAAAPADYRPKTYSEEKIKKDGKTDFESIELVPNPDIAKHFGNLKKNQILVGFAAESHNEIEYAKGKLKKKNLDMIVVNNIKREGAGFKSDTNIASIINAAGEVDSLEIMTKEELAEEILNRIVKLF